MKFSPWGSGGTIGTSNSGSGPSGSITVVPFDAKNTAICICAATDSADTAALPMLVRKVCGFDRVALCVKAADRLANLQACLRNGDTVRLVRYRREHQRFRDAAYRAGLCEPLWLQLERLTG